MSDKFINDFRKYRSRKLSGVGRNLRYLGITANLLTFLSLISGLLAIYYLFSNYSLFVIFTLLHLLFDSFDGVVARISKTTKFGKYFDIGSDSLITLLAIIKTGWFLQDYYYYFVGGLFFIALAIHFRSKLIAPIIFLRTPTFLILMVASSRQFLYTRTLFIVGLTAAGIVSLYSLAKQVEWLVKR